MERDDDYRVWHNAISAGDNETVRRVFAAWPQGLGSIAPIYRSAALSPLGDAIFGDQKRPFVEMVGLLLEVGADPNAVCHHGSGFSYYQHTPLGLVVWRADYDKRVFGGLNTAAYAQAARLLLQAGADVELKCMMNREYDVPRKHKLRGSFGALQYARGAVPELVPVLSLPVQKGVVRRVVWCVALGRRDAGSVLAMLPRDVLRLICGMVWASHEDYKLWGAQVESHLKAKAETKWCVVS